MATLGLLQLGHETTPELVQLFAMTLFMYGLAAAPFRHGRSRAAVLAALPLLAGSGAPAMALAAGLGGLVVVWNSRYAQVRAFAWAVAAAIAAAVLMALVLGACRWRARCGSFGRRGRWRCGRCGAGAGISRTGISRSP